MVGNKQHDTQETCLLLVRWAGETLVDELVTAPIWA